MALRRDPPVVVTSSTTITLSPEFNSPSINLDVPYPFFSLRIINNGVLLSRETAVAIGTAPKAGPATLSIPSSAINSVINFAIVDNISGSVIAFFILI